MKPVEKKHTRSLLFVALVATAAVVLPGTASAAVTGTTANSKVVNVVTVEYKDANAKNTFYANAATIVTVNLVKAALNFSAPPTAANAAVGLTCQTGGAFASGSTVSSLYALTANNNGTDSYKISIGSVAPTNVNNETATFSIVNYAGTTVAGPFDTAAGAQTVTNWASATPVGVDATNKNRLYFPGGALTAAGFTNNDIVVVTLADSTRRAYLVGGMDPGKAPTHAHADGGVHTDQVGFTQAEVQGYLDLVAFGPQSVTWNGTTIAYGGVNAAPDFTSGGTPLLSGATVSEMVLIRVDVTASSSSATSNGTVSYKLSTTDGAGTNPADNTCGATGEWVRTQLRIQKLVTKTPGSGWATTVAGGVDPGTILEYKVIVDNTGGTASNVKVTDAVPAYTTLYTGATYGAGGGSGANTEVFAKADKDGAGTVNLTIDNTDNEDNAAGNHVASGTAAGTTEGLGLTFYIGEAHTGSAGGTVDNAASSVYNIFYQVKVK